jgi:urease accessory protein
VHGEVLFRKQPPRLDIAIALFAFAGLVHGYALGESIAGAERTPLYAYFIGLAAIQAAIALAAMYGARMLAARTSGSAAVIRVLGAVVVGIGLAILVQQIMAVA